MVGTHRTFVIIGAGLAGAKAAETLRAEGFTGRVILIGDERDHPYQRPPLSQGYLTGAEARGSLYVHEPTWYARTDVELHLGQSAVQLDRAARTVRLSDGTRIRYDRLLLTTGAEPRRLDVPGTGLAGVHHLRRLPHATRLRGVLNSLGRESGRLVIAGAGWIGLEVAAVARSYGAEVTVVEPESTPLHGDLGPELGALFAEVHREQGVHFHFGARLTEITGRDGMVRAVRTDDGVEHPAQQVLAAVGAAPRTTLAEAAGLALADGPRGGVAVDAALRTSDPDIHAAGDVASAQHPELGTRPRGEHWANARHSGPAAARAMLDQEVVYDRLPYYFSDQYGLRLEHSGYAPPGGYDQVVCRGDLAKRKFVAFRLSDRRVLAGLHVNVWDPAESVQRLIRSGRTVDPEALADPAVPLETLVGTDTVPG